MINGPEQALGGMFDRTSPAGVGPFRQEFRGSDSNDSAKLMFACVDRLFEVVRQPGTVFLNTIELDVECGRFPEVLSAYFAHRDWNYAKRFFLASICKDTPTEAYTVGRLTFEAGPGQTAHVLAQNDGFRWGASLLIGGIQVPEAAVRAALRQSPFDRDGADELRSVARCAWVAGRNLDKLAAWPHPGDHDVQRRLSTLEWRHVHS